MVSAGRIRSMGRRTIVFVDEMHRFNKAQQDAFLPHVEAGNITLIGATTENPSFEVIAPLLSRMKVYVLHALRSEQIAALLASAVADSERGLGAEKVDVSAELLDRIATAPTGDAPGLSNVLRDAGPQHSAQFRRPPAGQFRSARTTAAEKADPLRPVMVNFNQISALHKSVRNSDADAALYWLARMIESGEDPMYLARRLVRMASEDIGLADPNALRLLIAAMQPFTIRPGPVLSGAR